MFSPRQLENILFLDIETVSSAPAYEDLSPRMQALWEHKSARFQRQDAPRSPAELYTDKAAILAEFGRVVCISCGYLRFDAQGKPALTLRSYRGADEKALLDEFGQMLNQYTSRSSERRLCAHNGKEFDFPYLGRRFLIQGLPLPLALQVQGKKPWETPFLDTMELWSFGDYKGFTSLDLLAAVFNIPSPKDDIDGSQVGRVFWQEQDHERIRVYCEKDVYTTAQILLAMSRLPLLEEGAESGDA
jgi:hypothetical protein